MSFIQDLLGLELVLGIRKAGLTPAPTPGPGSGPPTPGTFDPAVTGCLASGFDKTLQPTDLPTIVTKDTLGCQFAYFAEFGLTRGNCCIEWEGAINPPVSGHYKFTVKYKSGGNFKLGNAYQIAKDTEQDPGGHDQYTANFEADFIAGTLVPFKALIVEQGGEHLYTVQWLRPDKTEFEDLSSVYLVPPGDWKSRLKTPLPPVVVPPIPATDWSTYKSPDIDLTFPEASPWTRPVSSDQVSPLSDKIMTELKTVSASVHPHPVFGFGGNGITIEDVTNLTSARAPVSFLYADESDVGPYPIPKAPVIEPGSDLHWIGYHQTEKKSYEIETLERSADGLTWSGISGAIFDFTSNALRPDYWTSADAAGLSVLAGLVRYQDIARGAINHKIRLTVGRTRKAFLHPATHYASSLTDDSYPPMGAVLRLKATADLSGLKPQALIIAKCLQTYGGFVSDNGGPSLLGICGTPDSRWSDDDLATLKAIPIDQFEVLAWNDADLHLPV